MEDLGQVEGKGIEGEGIQDEGIHDEPKAEAVCCPSCGWFGMSDDCRYNNCPNCGHRVILEVLE
jgi:hypothetical protein